MYTPSEAHIRGCMNTLWFFWTTLQACTYPGWESDWNQPVEHNRRRNHSRDMTARWRCILRIAFQIHRHCVDRKGGIYWYIHIKNRYVCMYTFLRKRCTVLNAYLPYNEQKNGNFVFEFPSCVTPWNNRKSMFSHSDAMEIKFLRALIEAGHGHFFHTLASGTFTKWKDPFDVSFKSFIRRLVEVMQRYHYPTHPPLLLESQACCWHWWLYVSHNATQWNNATMYQHQKSP